jgi:hypothetical protein
MRKRFVEVSNQRRIRRWEYEHVLEVAQKRLDDATIESTYQSTLVIEKEVAERDFVSSNMSGPFR